MTPRRNTRAEDEAAALAAAVLAEYMADWDPDDVRDALSDLKSVDVYVTRPDSADGGKS
jgi:hypothetical protein